MGQSQWRIPVFAARTGVDAPAWKPVAVPAKLLHHQKPAVRRPPHHDQCERVQVGRRLRVLRLGLPAAGGAVCVANVDTEAVDARGWGCGGWRVGWRLVGHARLPRDRSADRALQPRSFPVWHVHVIQREMDAEGVLRHGRAAALAQRARVWPARPVALGDPRQRRDEVINGAGHLRGGTDGRRLASGAAPPVARGPCWRRRQ